MSRYPNARWFVVACCFLLALWPRVCSAQAISDPVDLALLPVQYEVTRLAKDGWAGVAKFQVDSPAATPSKLRFRIRSSCAMINPQCNECEIVSSVQCKNCTLDCTTIIPPPTACEGTQCENCTHWSKPLVRIVIQPPGTPIREIRADNIAEYNGTYWEYEGGEGNTGPFLLSTDDPGYHYYYDFDSQGPGQYSVQLVADTRIQCDMAVITELMTDSLLVVNLMAVTPEVAVGQTAVLTAMVFDGSSPALDANVAVTVIGPNGTVVTPPPTLVDTGQPSQGDHQAADGLYSGTFTPTQPGEYTIHAKITGYRNLPDVGLVAYERDAGTSLSAVETCATLSGSIADFGQDDNSNGRYEWLVIQAPVTGLSNGEWIFQVSLRTANGKTLLAYGRGEGSASTTEMVVQARVSADDIHAVGEAGPYQVVGLGLSCVDPLSGAHRVGSFAPNSYTHPYRLAQFELPPRDCNNNGISDVAEIELGLVEDCNHNLVPDECATAPPPALSSVASPNDKMSRAIAFEAPAYQGTGTPPLTAIRVNMIDLQNPNPANFACCPAPDFSTFERATCTAAGELNGCARWVGLPVTVWNSQYNPVLGSYRAARLQCSPQYHDWGSEGPVFVVGAEIIPSSTYEVEVYGPSCEGGEAACNDVWCPGLTLQTRRWADVVSQFNPPSPTSQPDAHDVVAIVNRFKHIQNAFSKANTQIYGNRMELNLDVSGLDLSAAVDALKGLAYPYNGPCLCPSLVDCSNAPACTSVQAGCMSDDSAKACDSGPIRGQDCSDNCACCPSDSNCPSVGTCPDPEGSAKPPTCVERYGSCIKYCVNGANDEQPCLTDYHCPSGTCGSGFCRDRCGRCN